VKTLILNADYQPHCVVSVQRAIVLTWIEDGAVMVEDSGEVYRSAGGLEFPVPSVVRLSRYVKVPFAKRAPLTRRSVLQRDSFECCYCTRRKATTIDHVIPRSRGGRHEWANVVAACSPCNAHKDDRTPVEAGMEMRFGPKLPEGVSALMCVIGDVHDHWVPYLVAA
jgi:5-methylcytosine-specific restriction endonuclease McrA